MNIVKQRLLASIQNLWQRLLRKDIPWARGYLFLSLLVLLGFALWIANQYLQERRLVEAIRRDSYSVKAYGELWSLYWETPSWPKRGQTVFQRLAAEYPDNPRPLIELAWLDYSLIPFKHTMTPEGLKWADQAVQLASDDDEALLSLAWLYFVTDEFEKAGQAAQKALEVVPDSSEAHWMAGRALKRSGDLEAAEREFRACVETTLSDEWPNDLCYTELITAIREMTITLHADHMMVQTRVEMDTFPEEVRDFLTKGRPPLMSRRLAWGMASIGPQGYGVAYLDQGTEVEIEPTRGIVIDQGSKIEYDELWLETYESNEYPQFTIENLPLTSYSMPTTVTVVAEGAEVISTTHPYETVEGDILSWQLASTKDPGQALRVMVRPDEFNRFKLSFTTSFSLRRFFAILLFALPTVWSLVVFIKLRRDVRDVEGCSQEADESKVHRWFRPVSILSWIFDATLMTLSGATVLYPLWLIVENYPYVSPISYDHYVFVLALLLIRLSLSVWHCGCRSDINLVRLGAVIFVCYLVVRLPSSYLMLFPVYVLIGVAVYHLLLVRNRDWLTGFDWPQLERLFSAGRKDLVEQIISLERLPGLESATRARDMALAEGQMEAANYEKSREILVDIVQEKKDELAKLRDELGIPPESDETPANVLFGLGPTANPLKNSLTALGFGLIPYLVFMILASYQGEPEFSSLLDFLRTTVGVPWGPIFLFFFGYFFHVIRGSYGVMKGLVFGGVLAVLNGLFEWAWMWNQVDGVELWGTTIRILITFVFVGAIMDWMTVQFSWRRIRALYDSPAFTTIITIIGTVVTTVATGLATGTMDRLLSIALQGMSAALGAPPLPGP